MIGANLLNIAKQDYEPQGASVNLLITEEALPIVCVDPSCNIGEVIVEKEQSGQIKAEYGKSVLLNVSKRLSKEIGKEFSKSNLFNMRNSF